jgi:hypothetical protein
METEIITQSILKQFCTRANEFYRKNEPNHLNKEFVFDLIRYAWSGVINFDSASDLIRVWCEQSPSTELFIELDFFNGIFYANGEAITIKEFIVGKKLDLIHFELPSLFLEAIYEASIQKN